MSFSPSDLLSECKSLIEQQRFADAVSKLQDATSGLPSAGWQATLGLAYFHQEKYGPASAALAEAVRLDPSRPELQELYQQARYNELSEVNVPVPDVYFFDRGLLLQPPTIEAGVLPPPPPPPPPIGAIRQIQTVLGNGLGGLFSVIMEFLSRSWGSIAGYRDRIWTNWYRRLLYWGSDAGYMREKLNGNNLKSTYPKGRRSVSSRQADPSGRRHTFPDGQWQLEQPGRSHGRRCRDPLPPERRR